MKKQTLILVAVLVVGLVVGMVVADSGLIGGGGLGGIRRINLGFNQNKINLMQQYTGQDNIIINKGAIQCTNTGTDDYCFSYVSSPYIFNSKWKISKLHCSDDNCTKQVEYNADELTQMRDDFIQQRINAYLELKQELQNKNDTESNADVVVDEEQDQLGG